MPSLLSAGELSRDRIERLIAAARDFADGRQARYPDAIVGLIFYEDSLRTRIGFDAAAARLGARTTSVLGPKQSKSMRSPERLSDAVRSIASWCDVLCLRHPEASAVPEIAALVSTPVINCGNGTDEHPTQALVDLFAIDALFGQVDGLRVGIVGDLDAMRTAHSLVLALSKFHDVLIRTIGPPGLDLPPSIAEAASAGDARLEARTEMDVDGFDVVYVAGLPAETRVGVLSDGQQAAYHVGPEVVRRLAATGRVMCPLPRVDEIPIAVDGLPQAAYFEQSELSLAMRMAILDEFLCAH